MMEQMRPRPLAAADLSQVEALFSDVDGTLTTHDRVESATLGALEALRDAGIRVVLVSGRSAGWGECWARQWPVEGVIVENGGLYFTRNRKGFVRVFSEPDGERQRARAKLERAVAAVMKQVPGARLSSDSLYREVDLAIDYNEEAKLGAEAAGTIERLLAKRGVTGVRSSVHVNCWVGPFDKQTAVRLYLKREWKAKLAKADPRWVYVGDSFNDAPMFAAFPLSVGVANVRDVLDRIETPPAFVTKAREGAGARELAKALLAARKRQAGRGA